MNKKSLKKLLIICLFITFSLITAFPLKAQEAHFVDTGYVKGSITAVLEGGREVKADVGTKDGLDKKNIDDKYFTVFRKSVPVAILEPVELNSGETRFEVKKTLQGINLEVGDTVTSESCSLHQGDLKILDSPYCELINKTLIGNKAEKVRWKIDPVYVDLLGDGYVFVSYGHPTLSTGSGEALPIFLGGDETSLVFLFDSKGERKWGYFTEYCVFKGQADMSLGFFNTYIEFSSDEPDYKISGDKLYLNIYENVLDPWAVMEFMKANGVYIALDLMTGQELWKAKAPEDDPAFYKIINNYIKNEGYLYSSEAGIYCVNLEDGKDVWSFEMDDDGTEEGIFVLKDGYLYVSDNEKHFYKLNTENGMPVWSAEGNGPFVRLQFEKENGDRIYLFDSKKSVSSLNTETGETLWSYTSDSDFTSPKANQLAGDKIYTFNEKGIEVFSKDTGSPVLTVEVKNPEPYFFEEDSCYCISHKKNICKADLAGGRVIWTFEGEKEIKKVIPLKDVIYVLDTENIYSLDKNTGRELFKREELSKPEYLEEYVPEVDPYNIINMGKVSSEEKVILIKGEKGFLTINPVTNQIILDKEFNDGKFQTAVGDKDTFYIASENNLWAVDNVTGEVRWNKSFDEKINFLAKPEDGKIYYEEEEYYTSRHIITSKSEKLLGMKAGDTFYILDKATGEVINQGNSEVTLYPYLEIEAMNKIKEKGNPVLFYCYEDSLYTFKRIIND